MREAVYLILVMAGAAPAGAAEAYRPHPDGPERPRTPTFDIPTAAEPRQHTPSAPRDRTFDASDLRSAGPVLGGAVPSLKASTTNPTTVRKSDSPILNVNLAIARGRRLDAPASGTRPDRAIDTDNSPAPPLETGPRALRGGTAPFDAPLRGEF